ncbi:MAG: type II toxin-antitoxin system HicA family toxin [Gammaproteobacteria bacterium]|nr:type II toxin-antitoxin system HicA family toxin [Gammaproteobacteria bacterium]MYD02931.1 type II toxin-antitoxin system HicA family toxin [Gammaproteobacteria bacterium]MYI26016.1 type II toxin-antitoxin system HicA family toxin [Gammaproteobacteria bacterium]
MPRFPRDAPRGRVIRALAALGFHLVRQANHISMRRENPDGSVTTLTLPGHPKIKASTLRTVCAQSGIARGDFLGAYILS